MPHPVSPADLRLLERLERSFAALAGDDAVIDADDFQRALGLRSEYLARRVLALFDTDGDGVVRRDEFIAGVRRLVFGTAGDKLAFAFRLHDHDGDGKIDRDEMRRMIAIGLAEDDARVTHAEIDSLATALFSHADHNRNGRISFAEMDAAVRLRPALLEQMTRSEARWIDPAEELLGRVLTPDRSGVGSFARLLDNRRAEAVVLSLWLAGNLACIVSGALSVYGRGTPLSEPFWMLSSAATTAMVFNAAILVVPVLRRVITRVRGSVLGAVVPVDHAVDLHRYVGNTLYGLAVAHVFAVLADDTLQGHVLHRLASLQSLSGLAWFVVFTFLWSFSRAVVRRSGSFELFYFSHLLYLAWFALALVHAPSVLGASALGLLGLATELIVRRARRGRRVRVLQIEPMRSGVTRIEFERPIGFAHHAGDWMFLRLPPLAHHEWHPFTISSAPERDTLTVHVRTLGNWTGALRRRVEDPAATRDPAQWEAYLDGPYGSSSGRIFNTAFPILIGAGIGVTPFASVLESLVLRQRAGSSQGAVQRAHFFWLNRDLYAFEWFRTLLDDLERQDTRGLLDVQVWLTGGHAGASAMGLELARELVQEAGGRDLVSGLHTRMRMEHPDWATELRQIQESHPETTPEVFFCGPPGLGRAIRKECVRLGMPYHEERF